MNTTSATTGRARSSSRMYCRPPPMSGIRFAGKARVSARRLRRPLPLCESRCCVHPPQAPPTPELLEWLGGPFDAERFDLADINADLRSSRTRRLTEGPAQLGSCGWTVTIPAPQSDGAVRGVRRGMPPTPSPTLPSRRVVRRDDRQYLGPLGIPLRTARLRLRLMRVGSPRPGPRRRASRVPHSSLHACCVPYPAGIRRASGLALVGHGLHRDMSGSAPGLSIFRGCRLHFMLRPACLLPP